MPHGYILRDKELRLKATIHGHHADKVMKGLHGEWDTIQFEGEKKQPCFTISDSCSYTTQNYTGALEIYFFEGDILTSIEYK